MSQGEGESYNNTILTQQNELTNTNQIDNMNHDNIHKVGVKRRKEKEKVDNKERERRRF